MPKAHTYSRRGSVFRVRLADGEFAVAADAPAGLVQLTTSSVESP